MLVYRSSWPQGCKASKHDTSVALRFIALADLFTFPAVRGNFHMTICPTKRPSTWAFRRQPFYLQALCFVPLRFRIQSGITHYNYVFAVPFYLLRLPSLL